MKNRLFLDFIKYGELSDFQVGSILCDKSNLLQIDESEFGEEYLFEDVFNIITYQKKIIVVSINCDVFNELFLINLDLKSILKFLDKLKLNYELDSELTFDYQSSYILESGVRFVFTNNESNLELSKILKQ